MKPTTKQIVWGISAVAALYILSFACVFQVSSSPVRNNAAGWLGPAKRSDPQTTDIGKVLFYEGSDLGAYHFYRPLCIIWLWIDGMD